MTADDALPIPGIPTPAREERGAKLSDDGVYRYQLSRRWAPGYLLPFVMLNPSTADAELDDPTIRRCRGFAHDLGFPGFAVYNLWAYRATKPRDLFLALARGIDVVGPENNQLLEGLFWSAHFAHHPVVAAWGAHALENRVAEVLAIPHARTQLYHLGLTAAGQPRHPLMLPKSARLTRWQVGATTDQDGH